MVETLYGFEETLRVLREGAKLCVPGATAGTVNLGLSPDGWTIEVTAQTRDAEGTYTHPLYAPKIALADLSNVLRNATAAIARVLVGNRKEAENRLRDIERNLMQLMGDDLPAPLGWTGVPTTTGARIATAEGSVSVRADKQGLVEIKVTTSHLSAEEARALSTLLRQCAPEDGGL